MVKSSDMRLPSACRPARTAARRAPHKACLPNCPDYTCVAADRLCASRVLDNCPTILTVPAVPCLFLSKQLMSLIQNNEETRAVHSLIQEHRLPRKNFDLSAPCTVQRLGRSGRLVTWAWIERLGCWTVRSRSRRPPNFIRNARSSP
jgi:hypothetical protein